MFCYSVPKSKLVANHAFNASIIFEAQGFSNKVDKIDNLLFSMVYRSSNFSHSHSTLYVKHGNVAHYDATTGEFKFTFSDTNETFGDTNLHLEDARFVARKSGLWLLLSHYMPVHNQPFHNHSVKQFATPFHNQREQVNLLNGISLNRFEKNWAMLERESDVLIFYQFYPEIVIYKNENNNAVIMTKYPSPHPFRGGTSPIEIGGKLYFFGHTIENGYRLSLMVLDGKTFDVLSFAKNIANNDVTQYKIVFCRGAVYIESIQTFIVSVGLNDVDVQLYTFTRDYLNRLF